MILEMHDVHVNLGLSHVLQGVNLSVHPGETVGLFGRNGVGKTTIFKTIAGWYRPSQGKILFQGCISLYILQFIRKKLVDFSGGEKRTFE